MTRNIEWTRVQNGGMTPFPASRFTSLTSTFQGKSASRSLRLSAQATVCRCSKHVSGASLASSRFWRAGRRHCDSPCFSLLPQRSVKWVWGFATTSDLQNSHSSTAGQVRVGRVNCCGLGALTSWWACVFASRCSAASLPRSLQHDDRSCSLGAAAEGKVRQKHPGTS